MDKKRKTVMCFGTFDLLHPGHLSYLEQARKYGNYLMAVVARDVNVEKIKGRLPKKNEKQRLKAVGQAKTVDQAVLGGVDNKYNIIKKYNPDVICLGYDQSVDKTELTKVFKGKVIRLKPYKEHLYKSSKLN